MLILHASWLPKRGRTSPALLVWGEASGDLAPRRARSRRTGTKRAAPPHPFSAPAEALKDALPLPGLKRIAPATLAVVRLPSRVGEPQPSRSFLRETDGKGKLTLATWKVPALAFEPLTALELLINFQLDGSSPGQALSTEASGFTPTMSAGQALGEDLRFWQAAARYALERLAGGHYLPTIVTEQGKYLARWRPLLEADENFEKLARAMPPVARAVTRNEKDADPSIDSGSPRALLTDFLNVLVDAFVRNSAYFDRKRSKRATPAELWLEALTADNPEVDLPPSFVEQYQAWSRPARAAEGAFRLCFRLDPPETIEETGIVIPKAKDRDWTVRYFLQANDDPSLLVPAEAAWRERGSTLKFLNRRFEQPQERLLAGLGLAGRMFAPIEASLREARPEACALTAEEAHSFIREAALLLQSSGFGVLLPGLGRGGTSGRPLLGVRLKLAPKKPTKSPQGGVAKLGFENVIAFDWELALGDQPLSREEFERLAALKVPLVQIRGQWVEVRPDQLQQALDFLEKRKTAGEVSLEAAMRMALAPDTMAGLPVTSVETEGWVGELVSQMTDQARLRPLPPPSTFAGTLRHYQVTGFSWLVFLRQFGLGACLADDMGLGKTPETIAYLLHLRRDGRSERKPALVVCPTSVVSNWRHELSRFAPELSVLVHHGVERRKEDFARQAEGHDVVITSYSLLHRDVQHLSQVGWGAVILDEAQNIKNPETRQAQAARQLRAEHRIALTGTPVENRLAELWSILQYLNPGYLGSQESFRANFARPIERMQDAEASRRLKALTAPFILRRVKTDPNVIQDLPAKNEMKVFCNLTKEQATLYQAVVRDVMQQIEEAEGIQRRGLVLAMLMKLKQVCNHPAHFLGDGSALPDRSGKLSRLGEMLDEVRAVKERALIFTQFAEMGGLLKAHLQRAFGDEVLFLHGGTPAKARTAMIDRFQNDPHGPFAFILSLKAGGTGLNLMRANHVFHFDRWWNPAVENQATDRAFRIGQTKNVQVHKFLCAGTVEERIDEMIERKTALAESIVGTSEAWITELSTEQLRDIFTLREEAVGG